MQSSRLHAMNEGCPEKAAQPDCIQLHIWAANNGETCTGIVELAYRMANDDIRHAGKLKKGSFASA